MAQTPFELLHPAVQHHVVNSLGWRTLRPLQEAAIVPVLEGEHALMLAPTAGGKTEAAVLPLLSRMLSEDWRGLGVLYLCPIKALLNNLHVRLSGYCDLVGRRCGLWHGDVGDRERKRLLADPPDILLTTPESVEAMLISSRVDAAALFRQARTVVIDEIHAFAGDDRGWHLLAVLERVERLASHRLQRIGLSATVGNPHELLDWLTLSLGGGDGREARVLAPEQAPAAATTDVALDWVGSLENAATVISRLHRGEKRLVFCDSRARTEQLAARLRERGVETYVSHSSLSFDERRRAESAFAQGSNCVIVATSTLELGVDVGDLDRVIQIDAPSTVASFLQRLGRTGRRPGSDRNCLFLATKEDAFCQAAGLLRLWSQGWVEPIVPPPQPRHLLGQQVLALALQEHGIGRNLLKEWLGRLPVWQESGAHDGTMDTIVSYMLGRGLIFDDGHGILGVGREGEAAFGRRHFSELTSIFTTVPLFTVLHGRTEIGQVHERTFQLGRGEGRRVVLTLGGRNWAVTHLDWSRRRAFVEPAGERGRSQWLGDAQPLSYELCQAVQAVLGGAEPGTRLTERAETELAEVRSRYRWLEPGATAVHVEDGTARWWTFAGLRANWALAEALGPLAADSRPTNLWIGVQPDVTAETMDAWRRDLVQCAEELPVPVDLDAVRGLKFTECLPEELAVEILRRRLQDPAATTAVLERPVTVAREA